MGRLHDVEPYYTHITQYALAHSLPLAYLDSSILIAKSGTSYQLTATGTKVMQAYAAVANGPGPGCDHAGGECRGRESHDCAEQVGGGQGVQARACRRPLAFGKAPAVNNQMHTQLAVVSVTVHGKSAYVYSISPTR